MMQKPTVYFVLPCYNEEEVLPTTAQTLLNYVRTELSDLIDIDKSKIVFVDDGSRDSTWEIITSLSTNNQIISGLKLANNFGHQFALLSGLLEFKNDADCYISLDADLQDDLIALKEMIIKYNEGFEVVYGVRKARVTDTFFKKNTALLFYKLMAQLGVNVVYNHADYRLSSNRVINELEQYGEVNLFLRGIFPLMGFKNTIVYYNRNERAAGESKYPFFKMLSFALDGITSFSIKPLRLIFLLGIFFLLFSAILIIYTIYSYSFLNVIKGWSSLMISIYFLGGVQMISIGIIGEYIGKIYKEAKHRPRYIIDKKIQNV